MNIPGITRALELDDADWDLAVKLRGLTEHQREQFSAALGPVKAQKKPERVIEHCADCDYTKRHFIHDDATRTGYHEFQSSTKKPAGKGGGGKSKREVSLRQQIGSAVQGSGNNLQPRCTAMIDDNGGEMECSETVDSNVHHKQTDPNYHPFVPPAQPAINPSSANGEVTDSTASSGMETGAAGVAHHGASGGD